MPLVWMECLKCLFILNFTTCSTILKLMFHHCQIFHPCVRLLLGQFRFESNMNFFCPLMLKTTYSNFEGVLLWWKYHCKHMFRLGVHVFYVHLSFYLWILIHTYAFVLDHKHQLSVFRLEIEQIKLEHNDNDG